MNETTDAPVPAIYDSATDRFITGDAADFPSWVDAIATARVTGSVGATYNETKVKRLYTSTGHPAFHQTGLWLVSKESAR